VSVAEFATTRSPFLLYSLLLSLVAGLLAVQPGYLGLSVLLTFGVAVIAITRLTFEGSLLTLVWVLSFVHLLKRAIFLFGDQDQYAYYAVLILPTIVLTMTVILGLRRARGWSLPSGRAMFLFAGWSLVLTLVAPAIPVEARLAAIHERLLPMAGFIVGLAIPIDSRLFGSFCKTIIWSAVVTVPYGLFQFFFGYTALERNWAVATGDYSVGASHISDSLYVAPVIGDARTFSYFADSLTWGFLLSVAIVLVVCLDSRILSRGAKIFALSILLLGAVAAGARTPLIGVIASVLAFHLLRWKAWRRPIAMLVGLALAFGLVVWAGSILYTRVFPALASTTEQSSLTRRYLTVGTVEARIGAWDGLQDALAAHPVVGVGLAHSDYISQPEFSSELGNFDSHNVAVDIVVTLGGVGLLVFVIFIFLLLRDGIRAYEASKHNRRTRLWLLAFVFGMLTTGFLNGPTFMTVYFFTLSGILVNPRDDSNVRDLTA